MTPGIKLEIIFVRHGISCGNVTHDHRGKKHRYNLDSNKVYDPELTNNGVKRSERIAPLFIKRVKDLFKDENYIIGASWLIRTHQTAYYMISKNTNKRINIMPHIAETGYGSGEIARSKDRQIEIYKSKGSKITDLFDNDWRDEQIILNKDNKIYFFNWINNNLDKLKDAKGTDGKYRLIIFSHGNWIKETLNVTTLGNGWHPDNNNMFHTILNDKYDINTKIEYSDKNLENTFNHENFEPTTDEMFTCPDECRVTFCTN